MKYENKRDPELMEFMKDIFKKIWIVVFFSYG